MSLNRKGLLLVLIGPSGSGKGTIMKELLQTQENTFLSVSATTRSPRPGELDGKDYFYITKQDFEKLIENDEMLEHACYCDNYYGTPKKAVFDRLSSGENVILEIEMQGAKQIKQKYPQAVLIFVIPPSVEVLRKRLTGRNTEDEETINKRMKAALEEIEFSKECDYVVINDELSDAVENVKCIVNAEKSSINIMKEFINEVLNNA